MPLTSENPLENATAKKGRGRVSDGIEEKEKMKNVDQLIAEQDIP